MNPPFLQSADRAGVFIRIKVVPGVKRDSIAGVLGDRLKVRVAAPPERGRANQSVCDLLAKALRIPAASVGIHSGRGSPEKVVRVVGIGIEALSAFDDDPSPLDHAKGIAPDAPVSLGSPSRRISRKPGKENPPR